jgi:hypothetical protein
MFLVFDDQIPERQRPISTSYEKFNLRGRLLFFVSTECSRLSAPVAWLEVSFFDDRYGSGKFTGISRLRVGLFSPLSLLETHAHFVLCFASSEDFAQVALTF